MWRFLVFMAFLSAMGTVVPATETKSDPAGRTVEIQARPQAWEARRAAFVKAVNAYNSSGGKDQAALARINEGITVFDKDPTGLTPVEIMDLFGVAFGPAEFDKNPKEILAQVASYAILGWYDALRFTDESGRAEILHNEGFFRRAFTIAGKEYMAKLADYLKNKPKEAEEAVLVGIAFARRLREMVHYEEDWPTGYGLVPMGCAMTGRNDCPNPPALPKERWDAAFEEAVARVKHYYRVNNP